jgi:hypothetical protein
MFTPKCIYCGARLIQMLGRLQIPASDCSARRKAVLSDWVKYGHSETEIRQLVKGSTALGPVRSTEFGHQNHKKHH